jgi:hypothetical protein
LFVAFQLRGCLTPELANIGGALLWIPAWAFQIVPLALGPMMLMWISNRITNSGASSSDPGGCASLASPDNTVSLLPGEKNSC